MLLYFENVSIIYLTLERDRSPSPLSFDCCILFSLPLLSAWHDSHCIGGCSYGEHGVRKPRDICNFWAAAGAGTQTSFHSTHLQTSASPPLPFPPTASWKGALSKWDTGVKARSLPALSAQGLAHYFHPERALSDLTAAAHAGSPAPPGPFGREEENWSCSEPCLDPSSLEWPKSQVAGDPPRESPSEIFPPSCWGSSTSLPHEPTQGMDSCTRLVLSHSRPTPCPGSLASDRTPAPALRGLLPPSPRVASSYTAPTSSCTCLFVTWHV